MLLLFIVFRSLGIIVPRPHNVAADRPLFQVLPSSYALDRATIVFYLLSVWGSEKFWHGVERRRHDRLRIWAFVLGPSYLSDMAPTNMDNDIFNKALDAFVETLAPDERALFSSCSSAEQLLADVRRLDPISKDRARGRGFLERITVFSEKLAPYFEVIGIIISSNPQYSAVVWGAIRLVLQLASNYTTFFDKLTRNLERFAQQFFQYDLLASLCKRAQPNEYIELVKSSLQDIYSNIFQFLRCVARVLTRKDGSKLVSTPQVLGSSIPLRVKASPACRAIPCLEAIW